MKNETILAIGAVIFLGVFFFINNDHREAKEAVINNCKKSTSFVFVKDILTPVYDCSEHKVK